LRRGDPGLQSGRKRRSTSLGMSVRSDIFKLSARTKWAPVSPVRNRGRACRGCAGRLPGCRAGEPRTHSATAGRGWNPCLSGRRRMSTVSSLVTRLGPQGLERRPWDRHDYNRVQAIDTTTLWTIPSANYQGQRQRTLPDRRVDTIAPWRPARLVQRFLSSACGTSRCPARVSVS